MFFMYEIKIENYLLFIIILNYQNSLTLTKRLYLSENSYSVWYIHKNTLNIYNRKIIFWEKRELSIRFFVLLFIKLALNDILLLSRKFFIKQKFKCCLLNRKLLKCILFKLIFMTKNVIFKLFNYMTCIKITYLSYMFNKHIFKLYLGYCDVLNFDVFQFV